jgi:Flp pilus assembly pilin Flp
MKNLIQRFIREEEGQDLVEYAFLIVFIALLMIGVLTSTEGAISTVFGRIVTAVNGAGAGS